MEEQDLKKLDFKGAAEYSDTAVLDSRQERLFCFAATVEFVVGLADLFLPVDEELGFEVSGAATHDRLVCFAVVDIGLILVLVWM